MSSKTELVENIIELVNVAYQSDYQAQAVAAVAQELRSQLESLDDGGEQTGLTQAELDQLNQYLIQSREKLVLIALDTENSQKEQPPGAKAGQTSKSGSRTDITNMQPTDHSAIPAGEGQAAVGENVVRREDDAPDGENK